MDDTLARLGRLDSCAVSDALDKLELAGAVTGIQRLTTDRRISGRVVTVKLEKDDGRPAASRHLGTTAIEAAQAGRRDRRSSSAAASMPPAGAATCRSARSCAASRAWSSTARRATPMRRATTASPSSPAASPRAPRAGGSSKTGTNVPITVGDVQVSPGDYVVADGSAVVFVKAADIDRVLDAAEVIADRERQMVADLKNGLPPTQVMGKNYETMLKR